MPAPFYDNCHSADQHASHLEDEHDEEWMNAPLGKIPLVPELKKITLDVGDTLHVYANLLNGGRTVLYRIEFTIDPSAQEYISTCQEVENGPDDYMLINNWAIEERPCDDCGMFHIPNCRGE